jgi:hypothetical protein
VEILLPAPLSAIDPTKCPLAAMPGIILFVVGRLAE